MKLLPIIGCCMPVFTPLSSLYIPWSCRKTEGEADCLKSRNSEVCYWDGLFNRYRSCYAKCHETASYVFHDCEQSCSEYLAKYCTNNPTSTTQMPNTIITNREEGAPHNQTNGNKEDSATPQFPSVLMLRLGVPVIMVAAVALVCGVLCCYLKYTRRGREMWQWCMGRLGRERINKSVTAGKKRLAYNRIPQEDASTSRKDSTNPEPPDGPHLDDEPEVKRINSASVDPASPDSTANCPPGDATGNVAGGITSELGDNILPIDHPEPEDVLPGSQELDVDGADMDAAGDENGTDSTQTPGVINVNGAGANAEGAPQQASEHDPDVKLGRSTSSTNLN